MAGKAADFGSERREIDQIFIPYLSMGAGKYLENPHSVATPLLEVKAQFGFLCRSAE
ncbi:hypothetical protein [Microbulbifer sp. ARAS458-1]|uniref:hypothetical protein n=1 Tax=Microbulbifer sp. ARAS458-1 TaxID=3140242 RepID=UPI003877B6AE